MIFSCIYNYFDTTNLINRKIENLTWISLINWIPFFWCFWGFQPYLEKLKERKKVARFLLMGTIPVIISGFLQYFFGITGPFKIFNGLIIWYQKPLSITDGLTGPFNNANYAGSWLGIIFPFAIYFLISSKKKSKRLITGIICFLFIIAIFLTNSRNSWIGMLISVLIIFGFNKFFFIFPLFVLAAIILTFLVSFVPTQIRDIFDSLLPINIFNNFPDNSTSFSEAFPRLEIWRFSLESIFKRPILGWGGGSFPILYRTLNDKWIGHPHNIIFEIAFNYGVLTAFIFSSTIFKHLYKFYKYIKNFKERNIERIKNNFLFDKAWFSSLLFITFSHLFDVQYFDLRISIICWILLSGIRASMI
jgi:O-antigen ligase